MADESLVMRKQHESIGISAWVLDFSRVRVDQ